jgi:hypothetical protein
MAMMLSTGNICAPEQKKKEKQDERKKKTK